MSIVYKLKIVFSHHVSSVKELETERPRVHYSRVLVIIKTVGIIYW